MHIIIKRLYEDNVLGKLSDERFAIMSKDYETEQKSLQETIIKCKQGMSEFTEKKDGSEKFAEVVKKYTDITELNSNILNELIDKVVVHEGVWKDEKHKRGKKWYPHLRTQQIDIYYNFIGAI